MGTLKLLAVMAFVLEFGTAAQAASLKPYTPEAFQAAQDGGQAVVVEVYAPWCPICARQQPILEQLEASPAYEGVTVLRVDFDSQKDALRQLRVAMQSTLIAFHGKTETGRIVGVVKKDGIEALFASARNG